MNKPYKKLDLNWSEIGFEYHKCPYRYQAIWSDGAWSEGKLITESNITVSEGSTSLHYSQQCFEGMKAQSTEDGRVLLFRPEMNSQRMNDTAQRLQMPEIPTEMFISAIEQTVAANYEVIPPFGNNASLYIRPFLIGIGNNLGLRPAPEYLFRVFVSPVGPYYKSGKISPLTLLIADFDRAAHRGIGSFKAGSNYAAGLKGQINAKNQGANELLFLDPLHNRFIEEAGSANIIVYLKDKTVATPKANTILPSITRKSAMTIAEKFLNLKTEHREIDFYQEVDSFLEMANCGTAAVISPIGHVIDASGNKYSFHDHGETAGPIMMEIRRILVGIQNGSLEDRLNWTRQVPI